MEQYVAAVVLLLMAWLAVGAWRLRKKRVTPGPAAAGMVNELLSNDRRAAIEIIIEERAAAHDPEHRDGHLPDLADPERLTDRVGPPAPKTH